uniref:BTBD8 BACK domain-containing protein n=1 Tax=Plectus sambesii TaxID=2011161 RepID=A0A914V2R9_9BILA
YFGRIWKGRSFLHLNHRWQNLCFQYLVDNLNSETVIDVLLGCEKLQVTLPRSKASSASEAVAALVSDLLDSAMSFLASQLDQVIASQSFSNQGKGLALNLSLLEDVLPSVVHTVSADLGCRTLMRLYELLILLTEFEHDKANRQAPSTGVYSIETLIDEWNERFINLVRRLYELCDTHLLHHAASVVKCDGWNLLTPAMQQRIQNRMRMRFL